ncbi:extracellular solute-binding protein [Cohnella suwonensis]|uniref:Extracellular solute-binding protein n=1 Tax=Cohnella suwonensis TaxID=696072 RepID=A0ABW0LQT9_9BACL
MKLKRFNFKPALALLVVAILIMSGCSNGNSTKENGNSLSEPTSSSDSTTLVNGVDISKELELTMYLVGDPQPDAELVYEEVNKKLKKDLNTTLKVKYIPWADMDKKYPLLFASGEEFDMIYAGDWVGYSENANKNAFKELTRDMIDKYMPDYVKYLSPDAYDQIKVNGKIYMIPYLNKQVVGHPLYFVRGDLREKYNIPPVQTLNDYLNYIKTVYTNDKSIKGYDGRSVMVEGLINDSLYKMPQNLHRLTSNAPLFWTSLANMDGKVVYALDDPNYINALKKAKELADAGMWSKGILSQKTEGPQLFNEGKVLLNGGHIEFSIQTHTTIMQNHPEWKLEVVDLYPDVIHESSSAARSGMAINARSKNAERAMLVLNLFGSNKEYYDLTTYGIAGKHFEPVGDNRLKVTELGDKNFPPKANSPWGWENKSFMRYDVSVPDDLINTETRWISDNKSSTSPVVSFAFNDTNVRNEMAAISNLYQSSGIILTTGLTRNFDADLAKFKDELKKAGIDRVREELQRQLTAFMQSFQ